ncbi:MAG TPA: hypothetical protein VG897_06430, partial [Terriglobales bacterium]|nr:hypothetical protein [Terriglobales bacterium]
MRRSIVIALFVCILSICQIARAHQEAAPECNVVVEALQAARALKAGDTRSKLELDFAEDGGLQVRSPTRYTFRKCHYIKIDVNFAITSGNKMEFLPTDKIVSIS